MPIKTASFTFRLFSVLMLLTLLVSAQGGTPARATATTGVNGVSVTVNTGTGSRDVNLDVPIRAVITNEAGNPLAIPPHTGDETYTINENSTTFTNCAAQTKIPVAECDALVALYNSTNGVSWIDNTYWLQTATPCSWYGITCDNGSNVTELDLTSNNLTGVIPPELGNLANLQVLYLGIPRAISIDPEIHTTAIELGNPADLHDFQMTSNQLSGAIPPELGNLTSLRLLALSDNRLSGAIPPQLGNLTNLQMLALDGNQLSGTIPHELGNLVNLQELLLRFNRLSGSIPPELGNLTNLVILALSNNWLSGSIPPELGNLTSLHYLVLNNDQLSGVVPPELGNLTGLDLLILSDNQLSGSIPELGNLTNLTWLYLHSNRISGEFPTSITNLVNLATFTFDCWITSTDPSVIAFIDARSPGWQNSTCPAALSITRSNPNPTSLLSVNFTVTFSESVSGVDISDFSLSYTSDITGASITSVSGSGTIYVVTVNTGTFNNLSSELININTATLVELYSLPAIGPTIAQRIIDYRTLNGPFFRIEDIMNVAGIGPNTFNTIKDLITVGGQFLRLNVVDNNSIVNSASNPLGGMAMGDGDFTKGEVYTIIKLATFEDVPLSYWASSSIERLYNAGITGGCSTIPLNYCPTNSVTRAQMAIFLLRGMHGSSYVPPVITATRFNDVPVGSFGAAFIEQLAVEGITSGCGGGNYCPTQTVSRAQMAIFLVRAKHGSTFIPPTATGIFADVPIGSFGANYIEQLVTDAVTSGCGAGNYCPNTMVKRDSMAVFLVKTFNLP